MGHWARDCPENKTEELAAILVADQKGSTNIGSKKSNSGKGSKVEIIDSNSEETSFDGMEICTNDQQCSEILNVSTTRLRNPEKLRIATGSEIKSYRIFNRYDVGIIT